MTVILSHCILFLWVSQRQTSMELHAAQKTTALNSVPRIREENVDNGNQNDENNIDQDDVNLIALSTSLQETYLPAADQTLQIDDNNQSKLMTMTEEDFLLKIRSSMDTNTPLDLTGYQVTLKNRAIRLKGRDHLEIHGGKIQGAIHSLFQIDGDKRNHPRRLTLRNTCLRHTKVHEDPREIGAAVFAMGSSVVVLEGCDISSLGGFAVWAKHRCSVTITNCQIHNVARTAVACFNSVQVTVKNSSLKNVGIHGICGRGVSVMKLNNVTLDHCQIRAVMVYQGATMELENCGITNTLDASTPTIHAQGPSSLDLVEAANARTKKGDQSKQTPSKKVGPDDYKFMIPSLIMTRCKVSNSAGPPLLVEGTVSQNLSDNAIFS